MKILLSNDSLDVPGGTETWISAMVTNLLRLNHEAVVFTLKKGRLADRLERSGVPVTNRFDGHANFDLALVNHNSCLNRILEKRTHHYALIFTSHGPSEMLEQPLPGADLYVAVSEEVKAVMAKKGFHASIIRNPIDCEVFCETRPLNPTIRTILGLSHSKRVGKVVRKLGRRIGAQVLLSGHGVGNLSWKVHEEINRADLVVTLGRGCYEAMACARNVVVHGKHGGDGFVDSESILEFWKCNCSGRRHGSSFGNIRRLVAETRRYDVDQGKLNRAFVLKHQEATRIIRQYLALPCGPDPRASTGRSASDKDAAEGRGDDLHNPRREDSESPGRFSPTTVRGGPA